MMPIERSISASLGRSPLFAGRAVGDLLFQCIDPFFEPREVFIVSRAFVGGHPAGQCAIGLGAERDRARLPIEPHEAASDFSSV